MSAEEDTKESVVVSASDILNSGAPETASAIEEEEEQGKEMQRAQVDGGEEEPSAVDGDLLEYDLGNLMAYDPVTTIDEHSIVNDDEYRKDIVLSSVRHILGKLWALPSEDSELDGKIAFLPRPTTKLPREKPLPEPKEQTRWEKFAERKGIKNTKRSRIVWDEGAQDWLPRYGLGSSKKRDRALNDWVIEEAHDGSIKVGDKKRATAKKTRSGMFEDPFDMKDKAKNDTKKKQLRNQLRNMRKAQKSRSAPIGVIDGDLKAGSGYSGSGALKHEVFKEKKARIDRAIKAAKLSTASMGRFDKEVEVDGVKMPKLKRRKAIPAEVASKKSSEREINSRIVDRILKNKK